MIALRRERRDDVGACIGALIQGGGARRRDGSRSMSAAALAAVQLFPPHADKASKTNAMTAIAA